MGIGDLKPAPPRSPVPRLTLRTVLGDYAHVAALKRGEIPSDRIALEFLDVKPTNRAFKPMVRELAFDVCELAIVTFLQAKAYGKPLTLLPAVMLGRFQHGCMLYNSEQGDIDPSTLGGRRVGVRAHTQTTAVWLRGILQNDYGVDLDRVRWVTFEDSHLAEYRDPPEIERATDGKDLTAMLISGEIDAAIYGAELPNDARLRSVIPNPDEAAQAWRRRHQAVPVNHLVVVREALLDHNPDAVREVYRMLREAKRRVPVAGIDVTPFGFEANRRALELIIDYAQQQRIIPRKLSINDVFDARIVRLCEDVDREM